MVSNPIESEIRSLAGRRAIKLTVHAHQEMTEESITADELVTSLESCVLLEHYPDHKRGACCLVCGRAGTGRFLHVVCTTGLTELVIITVYEPKTPKWPNPYSRGKLV